MIRRLVLHLLANAAAFYFISLILNGDFGVTGGVKGYFIAACVFGLLNSLVKPILKLLALPFMIMTLGLFTIVLNIVVLWLVKYVLNVLAFQGVGVHTAHIAAFFYAGLLIGVANLIISWLIRR
jgi:putative membrane protein